VLAHVHDQEIEIGESDEPAREPLSSEKKTAPARDAEAVGRLEKVAA
jgi:hypothetical protein